MSGDFSQVRGLMRQVGWYGCRLWDFPSKKVALVANTAR
jgi:hypothetical protein